MSSDVLCVTCTNTSVIGTGDSTVQMEDGFIKAMSELKLGDKVGAAPFFEPTY